eukprot:2517459-Prymnesium_polylepis.1
MGSPRARRCCEDSTRRPRLAECRRWQHSLVSVRSAPGMQQRWGREKILRSPRWRLRRFGRLSRRSTATAALQAEVEAEAATAMAEAATVRAVAAMAVVAVVAVATATVMAVAAATAAQVAVTVALARNCCSPNSRTLPPRAWRRYHRPGRAHRTSGRLREQDIRTVDGGCHGVGGGGGAAVGAVVGASAAVGEAVGASAAVGEAVGASAAVGEAVGASAAVAEA